MRTTFRNELLACCLGIIVGGAGTALALGEMASLLPGSGGEHGHGEHPIADPSDDEYHVHADFLVYLEHEKLDLAKPEYMTTDEQELHTAAHLHDGNGEVMHIHEKGVTFAEFITSLGFAITDTCLTTPAGEQYCETSEQKIQLYANGETVDLATYEPVDDDQLLLYYGDPDHERISEYLKAIPDDACYYSGTCPERGVAPPESCGLTCEL
jgi:hypothetical protein